MKQIKIDGKEYSALLNIRAAKTYQELTGKDIAQMTSVADVGAIVYACIDAAAKKLKVATPLTYDDVLDNLGMDELETIVEQLMPDKAGE